MADLTIDRAAQSTSDRNQLVAAIILGVAAVLTAFASYSSSSAGGDAANLRTDAGRTLTDANFFFAQANQVSAGDQSLFVAYAAALQQDDTDLAGYLTTLMRPEMQDAVQWWNDTDDAVTPFDEVAGNPYDLVDLDEAHALEATASQQLADSEESDEEASKFDLATVLLALTLFFAGIATLFNRTAVTRLLLVTGGVSLAAGTGILVQGVTA